MDFSPVNLDITFIGIEVKILLCSLLAMSGALHLVKRFKLHSAYMDGFRNATLKKYGKVQYNLKLKVSALRIILKTCKWQIDKNFDLRGFCDSLHERLQLQI